MNDEYTAPAALSAPRNMTGTEAHRKLREFWQSQPRPDAQAVKRPTGDIIANLRHTYDAKRGINNDEGKAQRAYQLITERGLTMRSAAQTVGMEANKIREWWRRLGLEDEA